MCLASTRLILASAPPSDKWKCWHKGLWSEGDQIHILVHLHVSLPWTSYLTSLPMGQNGTANTWDCWEGKGITHIEGTAHSINIGSHHCSVVLWVLWATVWVRTFWSPPMGSPSCLGQALRRWLTSVKTLHQTNYLEHSCGRWYVSNQRQCHNTPECLRLNSQKNSGNKTGHLLFNGKYYCYQNEQNKQKEVFPFSQAWKFCHIFSVFIGRIIFC